MLSRNYAKCSASIAVLEQPKWHNHALAGKHQCFRTVRRCAHGTLSFCHCFIGSVLFPYTSPEPGGHCPSHSPGALTLHAIGMPTMVGPIIAIGGMASTLQWAGAYATTLPPSLAPILHMSAIVTPTPLARMLHVMHLLCQSWLALCLQCPAQPQRGEWGCQAVQGSTNFLAPHVPNLCILPPCVCHLVEHRLIVHQMPPKRC